MFEGEFPLVLMGGRAEEGIVCADLGARTSISAKMIRASCYSLIQNNVNNETRGGLINPEVFDAYEIKFYLKC